MKDNERPLKPYFSFPFFEDDFWGLPSVTTKDGLSVSEDQNSVYGEAQLPGLKTEDIEVSFERGVLWIRGEKEEEDKDKKFYRKASNSFSYRIQVPGQIDENKEPEAEYKDGVLKVTFTKVPKAQPKKISIKTF